MTYDDLVAVWNDPQREVQAHRFHLALLVALNATHDHNSQDGFAVIEGIARLLAQVSANAPSPDENMDWTAGASEYVARRAQQLAPSMREFGVGATVMIEQ